MKTVYIVTNGCYSDYHIVGVFATEELAKECATATTTKYDDSEIEEWELNTAAQKLDLYMVVMVNASGKTIDAVCRGKFGESHKRKDLRTKHDDWSSPNTRHQMRAKDFDHAIKIANERRIQELAASCE